MFLSRPNMELVVLVYFVKSYLYTMGFLNDTLLVVSQNCIDTFTTKRNYVLFQQTWHHFGGKKPINYGI